MGWKQEVFRHTALSSILDTPELAVLVLVLCKIRWSRHFFLTAGLIFTTHVYLHYVNESNAFYAIGLAIPGNIIHSRLRLVLSKRKTWNTTHQNHHSTYRIVARYPPTIPITEG